MIRNNTFLLSTRNRSTLSHSLSRAQPQYPPVRRMIEPEILYMTGPSGQLPVPLQLHAPQPRRAFVPLTLSPDDSDDEDEIFPGPPLDFAHHDSSTMPIPDLIFDPPSPTTTSSLLSPKSSLSEISAVWDDHPFGSKDAAVKTARWPPDVSVCSDYSLLKHYQFVQPIWSVGHEEDKFLRQVTHLTNECARAPECIEEEVRDLEKRIIFEYSKYCNGREGHLSLSSTNTSLEDAVAANDAYDSALPDVSNVNLVQLIREFSPKHTVTNIMPHILAWVGPADTFAWTKEEKGLRMRKFQHLKHIIINEIKHIWALSRFEPNEKRGNRLLTRKEYMSIAGRLTRLRREGELKGRRYSGDELNASEAYQFLNTARGLDMLELLGRCLEEELVVSTDVTIIGETLAGRFCEGGYSFGLFTLFKYAGDKICRGNAEKYACMAADVAAKELWLNVHSYEDRELHTRLGRMVDEYGDIQRKKYSAGAPNDRPDRRPRRANHRRRITFVSNLNYYL